ncbi:cytochrome P450 [Dendrothele bispora CBS 962.96]|uniref:Cytochrome P450 n=1 Tax=Dendrothele bispora (strain CBS 962.96) TaxID=1314807 RepID=A0A4S8M8H0_DENBC|nr:cytochrome P450 [Dendrothele bispora CBS 962.96]
MTYTQVNASYYPLIVQYQRNLTNQVIPAEMELPSSTAELPQATSYSGGLPCIGEPGILGYLNSAIRCRADMKGVLEEGRARFNGRPFVIRTFSGIFFVLGNDFVESIKNDPDKLFDQENAFTQVLLQKYTLDVTDRSALINVLRTSVSRSIESYITPLLEETQLSVSEAFKPNAGSGLIEIPIVHVLDALIARVTNRVIVGEKLCRSPEYQQVMSRFIRNMRKHAGYLRITPPILRPREPLKGLRPYVKACLDEAESAREDKSMVHALIRNPASVKTVEEISKRVLFLNFASTHTSLILSMACYSSVMLSRTLFELAALPKSELDAIRNEVAQAIEEDGWTKKAVLKFRMIDSALTEVGRVFGLAHVGSHRIAKDNINLGDGTCIPVGSTVVIDHQPVHFDEQYYDDPEKCDLLRFSKLRDKESRPPTDPKHTFAFADGHALVFSTGRHACPGRFFASTLLKIVIGHILLNYDLSYPPETKGSPRTLQFDRAVFPDPKATLIFTKRQ